MAVYYLYVKLWLLVGKYFISWYSPVCRTNGILSEYRKCVYLSRHKSHFSLTSDHYLINLN